MVARSMRKPHITREGISTMNGKLTACLLASALVAAAALPAAAQDKAKAPAAPKQDQKVILENEKVRVTETRWVPGATSDSAKRATRVVRALKGGTLERTYPDGKKELSTYKTGEVKFFEADGPYALKNTGRSEIVLYSVAVK